MIASRADLDVVEARRVTRRVAKTFALATRLLPPAVRRDVYLLYLVCRWLDDAVDNEAPDALHRLDAVRAWIATGDIGTREVEILARLRERHPGLPLDAVADFCDGQEQDLRPLRVYTEQDLDAYAYRVAGTVGRLMTSLLGSRAPEADLHARALGIAMQRTNILRDVDEDLERGRVYLPEATLEYAGVSDLRVDDRSVLIAMEVGLARLWYARGMEGIRLLRHGQKQVRAAALMYRGILDEIERDGYGQRRPWRSSVPASRKLRLVLGAYLSP